MRAPSAVYKCDTTGDTPQRVKCVDGTRVEILGRIAKWATDASSPPIFWLSGMAGRGKSTIAYSTCLRFDPDVSRDTTGPTARLCASFFCSRQVDAMRQLQNVIPTLAYQLASSVETCSDTRTCTRNCSHLFRSFLFHVVGIRGLLVDALTA